MKFDEKPFLLFLFDALGRLGISYAVLRNAETLPDSLDGGDIDIIVASRDWKRTQDLLREAAEKCGGRVMGRMTAPHFAQTEMMGCINGVWWGCCIDLFDGVYVRSVLPIAGELLLEHRVDNGKGVWTLPHDLGDYLGFVKELLVAGRRSARYEAGAKRAIAARMDDILLSRSCRDFIRCALADGATSARVFVMSWMVSLVIRHPIYFWKNWLGFMSSRVWRYIRPCGKMIAVLGTDGSGKSTLLNEVLPLIQTMTHKSTVVHHLKPDFLPPLGRLRGVKNEPGNVCTNPHGSRPSGLVGSIARLMYLTTDYVLGYWLKVRFKIAKTPIGYWVFDRYAYDILLDPRRFRISMSARIIRFLLVFLPRPDLVICLGGDPARIFARKPETSLSEVSRQVQELKEFAMSRSNAIWIDTTLPIEDSSRELLHELMRTLGRTCRCVK